MKKLLLLFAVLLGTVGAWAQLYQKVPHTKWIVTALNEARVQGDEGGVAYLKDEDPSTFWHSDYSNSYSDGTSGKKKGQDGLQCFMVDMAEVCSFDRITYAGRSNGGNNWATKVRVYAFEELPSGWPKNGDTYKALSALTYTEKEKLLKKDDNTVLGTPIFDNNNAAWASDQNIKTIDFTEAKSGRYILFVADATSTNNGYLTCSDFHVWQKVDGIVEDKPYFLKIANAAGEGEWYLDTHTPIADNQGLSTIGKSANSVATYFSMVDGYWHISTKPGLKGGFVGVSSWCAPPQSAVGAGWTVVKNSDGTICLKQHDYLGGNNVNRTFLGGDVISNAGVVKVYTDHIQENAVKIQLVELSELEAAKESARQCLSKTGVGYPVLESEARTTLQAAIDAQDATVESVSNAVDAYNKVTDVVLPEAGKVYRIVSANPNFFKNQKVRKAVYSNKIGMRWMTLDNAAMNQLWAVESIDASKSTMTFFNVADAMYPQANSPVGMHSVKNESAFSFVGAGQFNVKTNKSGCIHANWHSGGSGKESDIILYGSGLDNPSSWYIEEVAVTKEILAAQINAIKTAYIGSVLIKAESIAGLSDAVTAAQKVHDENGNYAEAFADLVAAVRTSTIEYIDLGYFYMKSKGAGKYAYNDNTALKVTDSKGLRGIFKFTKAKNGSFYVQNGNGFYAQGVNTSQLVQTSSAKKAYHVNKMPSDHYVLRPEDATGTYNFLHDANNGTGNIVGWETAADNTQWTFEALSEEDLAKIYTVNISSANATVTYGVGAYAGDKDVKADGGFYVLDSAPADKDFTVNGVTEGLDSRVFVSGSDITVLEGYDSENIYIIRSKNGSSYARYHSGCKLNAEDKTNMLTYENNNLHWESLFYIEEGAGDYTGYYTIRPVSAPNLYVYNLNVADEDSKVATKERPAEGELTAKYYWKISSFGAEYGNITPHGGDTYGWNKRGSNGGYNHIGYWNGHNDHNDNKWVVRKAKEELVEKFMPHTTDDSTPGLVTYEAVNSMLPYIQMITQERFNSVKNGPHDLVTPKAGKFYRIKNNGGTGYLSGNAATTGRVKFVADIDEQASSIFYFENNKLLSYVTGLYLAKGSSENFVHYTKTVGANAGIDFTFKKSPVIGKLLIEFDNNTRSFYSAGVDKSDAASAGQTEDSYRFTVENVTSLPFTFKAAALGYATFHAPVNVDLSGTDVVAYIAEIIENESKLKIRKIEGNVVPAETPVLLYKEGVTSEDVPVNINIHNVTCDFTAKDLESQNNFYGTVAAEITPTNENVYSLQRSNSAEVVGFYKKAATTTVGETTTPTTMGGFKAWIKTTMSNARAFTIIFDGDDATGLKEALGIENEKVEIYDLSGRRLDKPTKGINIINGKKVIK